MFEIKKLSYPVKFNPFHFGSEQNKKIKRQIY